MQYVSLSGRVMCLPSSSRQVGSFNFSLHLHAARRPPLHFLQLDDDDDDVTKFPLLTPSILELLQKFVVRLFVETASSVDASPLLSFYNSAASAFENKLLNG